LLRWFSMEVNVFTTCLMDFYISLPSSNPNNLFLGVNWYISFFACNFLISFLPYVRIRIEEALSNYSSKTEITSLQDRYFTSLTSIGTTWIGRGQASKAAWWWGQTCVLHGSCLYPSTRAAARSSHCFPGRPRSSPSVTTGRSLPWCSA
jgi:hypothetical protein